MHRILFVCAEAVAKTGCSDITEIEIDNFASKYEAQKETLEDGNFAEFVSTVKELASLDNFDYYYGIIRKFSLLRELKEQGIDISSYYNETEDEQIAQQELDKWSIQDILSDVESKANKLRTKYDVHYVRDEIKAGENPQEFIDQFKVKPSFGALMQSGYLSTLYNGWNRGHLILRAGNSGSGKALPNYTVIPTPNGDKKVGEISVGDYLYDRTGKPTKVLGVFPQGKKQIWKIEFRDGRIAECCEEHLWSYYGKTHINGKFAYKLFTKELKEIYKDGNYKTKNNGLKYKVPVNQAVEKNTKKYFISPYVFGLILGDGSFREQKSNKAFSFSSSDMELVEAISKDTGWDYKKVSNNNYSWNFYYPNNHKMVWIKEVLAEYPELINAYSQDKFIPEDYLNGSIQQRKDLLSGLLDSDGSIGKKGRVSYFSTSETMIKQVQQLCFSLGYIAHISVDNRNRYASGYGASLSIQCSPDEKKTLFRLTRKKELAIKSAEKNRNEFKFFNPIIKIYPTEQYSDMTCFLVDNKEHLFLMNDYIVTHNTRSSVADLCCVGATEIWDDEEKDFIPNKNYQSPTLFIATEQDVATEVQPMFYSAISGVEYRSIVDGRLTKEEESRVLKAGEIISKSNLTITSMPRFTKQSLERKIKEKVEGEGIAYCCFDYMEVQAELSSEFKKNNAVVPRQDLILLDLASYLKMIAEDYNVGILTGSQLNDSWKDMRYVDEGALSGSKAMKFKLDAGSIVVPTSYLRKDMKILEPLFNTKRKGYGENRVPLPNVCEFIFKSRYGTFGDRRLKMWSYFDKGTFKRFDYFVTDDENQIVKVPISKLEDDEF